MARDLKLFVLVRADLPVGVQLAQVAHVAARAGLLEPPCVDAPVAVLHVQRWEDLRDRMIRAQDHYPRLRVVLWQEPDLGGAMTTLAIYGDGASSIVRDLPLAFAAP